MYFPDDEPGRGQWWSGKVVLDQRSFLEPEEAAAQLASPWACEVHWERFCIHWDEPPVRALATPPRAASMHCTPCPHRYSGDAGCLLPPWSEPTLRGACLLWAAPHFMGMKSCRTSRVCHAARFPCQHAELDKQCCRAISTC